MGLFGMNSAPAADATPGAPDAAAGGVVKKRILLCEDDAFFSQAINLILSTAGYEIVTAADGTIGLQTLQTDPGHFNLILCDIKMPNTDGFGVIKEVKKEGSAFKDIPFVFLTGVSDMDSVDRARELGASDYFIKANADLPKIKDLVEKYL